MARHVHDPGMTYATNWIEVVAADEAERFTRYAEQLREMQRKLATEKGVARGLHAKMHAGFRASFEVLPTLPPHVRAGVFAKPATYEAVVRFSNGNNARQSDRRPDVRGLAIKILGVDGKKILPGSQARTQDFLLIHNPVTPVANAAEFMALVRALARPALLPWRLARELGIFRTLRILHRLFASRPKIQSLANIPFFSAAPIRLGACAAKLAVFPQHAPSDESRAEGGPDRYGHDLRARLLCGALVYDFRVQLYVDPIKTPIEDTSVLWSEADAPFIDVAKLVIHRQDASSPDGVALAERIEHLSFDPWHATVDLRPLGDMMRARRHAYYLSVMERGAAPEPDEAGWLEDAAE